jgi:hypothetical protein
MGDSVKINEQTSDDAPIFMIGFTPRGVIYGLRL